MNDLNTDIAMGSVYDTMHGTSIVVAKNFAYSMERKKYVAIYQLVYKEGSLYSSTHLREDKLLGKHCYGVIETSLNDLFKSAEGLKSQACKK